MEIKATNISFNAGLTSAMKQEIKSVDVKRVSNELLKLGVASDFKENKLIAWSSLKCVEIINELNKKYNLKLGLPTGIFVEDFDKLGIEDKESFGICTLVPAKFYLEKEILTQDKTIFFNEFKNYNSKNGSDLWAEIDEIADSDFKSRYSSTDFFLDKFLHEFMHVLHENNLLSQMSKEDFMSKLKKIFHPMYLELFQARYGNLISSTICKYASSSPLEAVACDLSKRMIGCLDKNTLRVNKNPFDAQPYKKTTFYERHTIPQKKTDKTLRKFWNGIFD